MDDLKVEVRKAIIEAELDGVKQQIYRLSIAAEARKIAGYTEEENKLLLGEMEKLLRMRDFYNGKLASLEGYTAKLSGT